MQKNMYTSPAFSLVASGIPMLAPPPTATLAACIAPSSTFEDCQAAAPAAARTHRAVPTSPPRTSSSCRTCTSMRYMLPLASSASRSHTHIAQTVPLQKVFSTACSGILCASSAPQAPPRPPAPGASPVPVCGGCGAAFLEYTHSLTVTGRNR